MWNKGKQKLDKRILLKISIHLAISTERTTFKYVFAVFEVCNHTHYIIYYVMLCYVIYIYMNGDSGHVDSQ